MWGGVGGWGLGVGGWGLGVRGWGGSGVSLLCFIILKMTGFDWSTSGLNFEEYSENDSERSRRRRRLRIKH